MKSSRRAILAAGTVITALAVTSARSKAEEAKAAGSPQGGSLPFDGPTGTMRIYHVWADEDGVSHIRTVYAGGLPKPIPAAKVVASSISQGTEDWHVAPMKTFTINTHGDIEAELGDGTKQSIGQGDLVYLEDLTGKGHITRLLTNVCNLFIQVDPEFDFDEWLDARSRLDNAFE